MMFQMSPTMTFDIVISIVAGRVVTGVVVVVAIVVVVGIVTATVGTGVARVEVEGRGVKMSVVVGDDVDGSGMHEGRAEHVQFTCLFLQSCGLRSGSRSQTLGVQRLTKQFVSAENCTKHRVNGDVNVGKGPTNELLLRFL